LTKWRVLGPKKVKYLSWLQVHVQNPIGDTGDVNWRFAKVKKGERKWVNLPDGGVVCYGPCSVVVTGQAKIPRWPDPTFHLATHAG
jgi:hypothetical protein